MYILKVAKIYEPDPNTLPAEFRDVLTPQDMRAIKTGSEYFGTIAGPDSPRWLKRVLAECAATPFELQFVAANDRPYRPYFRFGWVGEPAIALPRKGKLRRDIPTFLRHVYGVIGAFRENDFDMAGGLNWGDGLVTVSESGMWVQPGGVVDAAVAVPFLETFSGSQLCYLPDGSGAWLESCKFRKVRSLERETARYFEALLKGTRI